MCCCVVLRCSMYSVSVCVCDPFQQSQKLYSGQCVVWCYLLSKIQPLVYFLHIWCSQSFYLCLWNKRWKRVESKRLIQVECFSSTSAGLLDFISSLLKAWNTLTLSRENRGAWYRRVYFVKAKQLVSPMADMKSASFLLLAVECIPS